MTRCPRGALAAVVATLAVSVGVVPGALAAPSATSPATMRQVVRDCSRYFNAADNAALTRLFRLPAIVEQGGVGYRLKTARHLAVWHDGLPCAGRVTSITIRGNVATAVFVLGDRPSIGSSCGTPGERAAAAFEIVDGKIVHWTQVAVPAAARKPPGPVA